MRRKLSKIIQGQGDTGRQNPPLGFYYPSLSLFLDKSANIALSYLLKNIFCCLTIHEEIHNIYILIFNFMRRSKWIHFVDMWRTVQRLKLCVYSSFSFSENNGGAAHDVNRPHVTNVHQLQVLHLQATWMHQVEWDWIRLGKNGYGWIRLDKVG